MNDSDDDNLIGFIAGTVEGLREQVGTISGQMTTKEDLARLEGQMETMRDQMATKEDLARLEGRLSEKLNTSTTAIRGDIEQVHLRMDGIEHASTSRIEHVEGELSRLRSAVYLLGKDRPEVLRLLGQTSS